MSGNAKQAALEGWLALVAERYFLVESQSVRLLISSSDRRSL